MKIPLIDSSQNFNGTGSVPSWASRSVTCFLEIGSLRLVRFDLVHAQTMTGSVIVEQIADDINRFDAKGYDVTVDIGEVNFMQLTLQRSPDGADVFAFAVTLDQSSLYFLWNQLRRTTNSADHQLVLQLTSENFGTSPGEYAGHVSELCLLTGK
jgi:hypothetical protein